MDATYTVYNNMHSQRGGAMLIWFGTLKNKVIITKIECKKFNQVWKVEVSKTLSHNMWITKFMSAQGYLMDNKLLMQDNSEQ